MIMFIYTFLVILLQKLQVIYPRTPTLKGAAEHYSLERHIKYLCPTKHSNDKQNVAALSPALIPAQKHATSSPELNIAFSSL